MSALHTSHRKSCVLAIGAHPDDVVISVGGTLAQLADAGHPVVILTLSSGEAGGVAAHRESEELEAARQIGAQVEFGRLPDSEITMRPAIRVIDRALARYQPDIVLVHSAQDTHQDHIVASEAANVSCRRVPTLLGYESPSSQFFQPTMVMDVTDVWDRKLQAARAHASQVASGRLLAWIDAVGRYRAWPRHVGGFCEGLRVCHAEALPLLSARQMASASDAAGTLSMVHAHVS